MENKIKEMILRASYFINSGQMNWADSQVEQLKIELNKGDNHGNK